MTDDTDTTDATSDRTATDPTDGDSADGPSTDAADGPPDWPPSRGAHPLADRLREQVVPLASTGPDADGGDLRPVVDRLANARVVGLGEASHGSRECFDLKRRLIAHLAERDELGAVALEADFAAAVAIDEYVVHGAGDPVAAIEGLHVWPWKAREVLALVERLREINATRAPADRVRFLGIDGQFTASAAAALSSRLADADPDLLDVHGDALAILADEGLNAEDSEAAAFADRLAEADRAVGALESWVDAVGPPNDGDARESFVRRGLVRTLGQAVDRYRALEERGIPGSATVRDRALAENASRLLADRPHDRVVLWAHDDHVQRGTREKRWGTAPAMGRHLADRYGDDYHAVGFDFAGGAFRALDVSDGYEMGAHSLGPPPEGAATRLFAAVADPPWFLDLDAATEDERIADWFGEKRAVRSVGAVYDPDDEHRRLHDRYRLAEAFDGLVFLGESSPTRPLDSG